MSGFEIEPSIRAYGLWEHQSTHGQPGIAGRAQFQPGAPARHQGGASLDGSATATVTPCRRLFDYYFNSDDAQLPVAPVLLPSEFVQGWSARVTSGLAVDIAGGPKLSVGGEVGGLGSNQFTTWSVRGRAAVPF